MEPLQEQAGGSHSGGCGQDPHQTWSQGPLPRRCVRDNGLSRGRHRWSGEHEQCLHMPEPSPLSPPPSRSPPPPPPPPLPSLTSLNQPPHHLASPRPPHHLNTLTHLIPPPPTHQEGLVYAVEFSHRSGRDLMNVAKKRTNIIPIIEDARHPHKYRMLVRESHAHT